ncbi:3'(2'),5'-bisphosphate nucleotidase CysQ [Pseudaminobacter sp. NGMCC 1.201702]|uniref:3'(2'),5'-bisphosphate nucleotidase CysQ n=1 Tax=Pseudaminobacter sp. NGMCC 1.201702 TaxID=3391825 RepID=UPI0039F00AD8
MPEAEPFVSAAADDLPLLLEAAREAGEIALRYFKKDPRVWMKAGQSPVSEADYAADKFLRETLMAARPDYGWLSEETADDAARLQARRTFVVDPIDGTRAFIQGLETWCVSVAVVEGGQTIAGVLDCPALGEIFSALPGRGARRNGEVIHVREAGELVEIGGPKHFFDAMPRHWQQRVRRVAHIPSLAYRLAMIAEGRLDATFVRSNAHDWDIAAADLILREAGGQMLDAFGKPPSYGGRVSKHGVLVAGSGPLLKVIAGVVAEANA